MKSLIHAILSGLILGCTIILVNQALQHESSNKIAYSLFNNDNAPVSYYHAIERSAPAVVNIFIQVTDLKYDGSKQDSAISNANISSASGIIMHSDGYILTNYHVIMNASMTGSSIYVQLRNGKTYLAKVLGYDKRTDIAVLKVTTKDVLPVIPINTKTVPRLGDVVLAIGNPYNIGQTVTVGIISAVGRSGSGITNMNTLDLKPGIQEFIQTDAAINSGNSGGALVNTKGEYIGMNTATLPSVETQTNGISFAISAELSLKIMQEIIHHGRVIRGYLGILARDSAYSDIQDGKLGSYQSGIIVTSIDPNGPAQDILMQNDVIVSINDVRVTDLKQAMTMIASSKPDTVLNFSVVRDGKLINCQVTVVEQI